MKINSKFISFAVVFAIALYACHIAGVASMPGQNQSFFLDWIYASQLYLFAAVVGGHSLGTKKVKTKALLILLVISVINSLIAIGFAGTASMEGPNQLGFLGQFFVIEVVLIIASLGAYVLGTRHNKAVVLVSK